MHRTMKPALILIVATFATYLLCPEVASAQGNFMGNIHFNSGLPQGEFDDQLDREAFGVGGQIFYSPSSSPLAVGIDLGWANYGSDTRREPFSSTIPDVAVDVETTNNFAHGFLVLRGQMPSGPVRLYGDALVGLNYLYTETSVKDTEHGSDAIASSVKKDDTAFAYGAGGGVMVPVWMSGPKTGAVQQVLIDAGARYVWGGEAEYLKKGAIHRSNDAVILDSTRSRTDMMNIHFGVSVRF